jgi:hypothetical protein
LGHIFMMRSMHSTSKNTELILSSRKTDGRWKSVIDKVRLLKYYFWFFGLFNVLIVSFTVPILFGDLLLWKPRNIPIEMMISVIYLAMGIIMIFSANNPLAHKSFLQQSINDDAGINCISSCIVLSISE